MTKESPTLVLFDIDGTLLTADRAGSTAFELALSELHGHPVDMSGISFAGKTDWQILQEALLPIGYSREHVAAIMAEFAEMVAKHMKAIIAHHHVRPMPGALSLVRELAVDPRARLGLVTGNVGAAAPLKLEAAGFDPLSFPVGAFGHEAAVRSGLPPLALRRARDLWQTEFPPGQIVIVGDTPNDVICARSVGARALAVLTGPAGREALAAEVPYAILKDLSDRNEVEAVLFGGARYG